MAYDESERIERNLHGITYMANATENRRVTARVVQTEEWRQYAWRDDLIKSHGAGEYHASTEKDLPITHGGRPRAGLHWICKEAAEWFQRLAAVTLREVEAMEAER